ncbi:chaplin [Streptomyces sp. NPDC054842]
MRQVTRKGLMTMAAATGVLAAAGGYAQADSGAHGSGSNSPGVLSGNTVQAPVHAPVNVCGNTVNVVGLLNPAMGNKCADQGGRTSGGHGGGSHQGGGSHHGGSHAGGHAGGSPGVGSGNHVQVPVDVPVNVCGNSVNVGGVGNPAAGNACGNDGGRSTGGPGGGHSTPPSGRPHHPGHPGDRNVPPGQPGGSGHHGEPGQKGEPGGNGHPGTPSGHGDVVGASQVGPAGARAAGQPQGGGQLAHTGSELPMGLLVPAGAGALLGGALLYRRARSAA